MKRNLKTYRAKLGKRESLYKKIMNKECPLHESIRMRIELFGHFLSAGGVISARELAALMGDINKIRTAEAKA